MAGKAAAASFLHVMTGPGRTRLGQTQDELLVPASGPQGDGNVVAYYGTTPFHKFGMTAYWDSGTWMRPDTVRPAGWTGGFYLTLHVSALGFSSHFLVISAGCRGRGARRRLLHLHALCHDYMFQWRFFPPDQCMPRPTDHVPGMLGDDCRPMETWPRTFPAPGLACGRPIPGTCPSARDPTPSS